MKKKIITLLLTLTVIGMISACGSDKESDSKKEETETEDTKSTEEEFVLTNDKGKVVAVDIENLEDYITLGEYKNLEVEEAPKKIVSDEETEEFIYRQLVEQYKPVEVTEDRAVQMDDTVNIDYTGYKDGEPFDGGSDKGFDLRIGSGKFIDGFEDGLIGHKKGEEVTLDLTFPENYGVEELNGQAVQFKVKINKISEPATVTDEWAAANTEYKTADEYKAAQKEILQVEADNEYDSQVRSDLFKKVVENSEIKKYPEDMLKDAKKDVEAQLESMAAQSNGMTLEEYYEAVGITEEDAKKNIEAAAKSYLDQNLVVQAILNAEKVELTEEEYHKEEEAFAKLSGFPDVETMKQLYSDQQVIKDSVLWNKACDIILSTATIKEKAE